MHSHAAHGDEEKNSEKMLSFRTKRTGDLVNVNKELQVRAVENKDEEHQAHDLMIKVHELDYFKWMQWMESTGIGFPGFRREHTRIALLNGQLVGALRLTSYTIRIGEARLRMGGLGWVTTNPRFRKRGVATALMEDVLHYMREHGYHVSMLFGIPNFYHKFGYSTSLAEYATTVTVGELSDIKVPKYKLRKGKPGDISAISKIHNQHEDDVACSLIRGRAHISNQWRSWENVQVMTNEQGKVFGYFVPRLKEQELILDEAGVLKREECRYLLHACAKLAHESYRDRIRFRMPPEHIVSRHLMQYRSNHVTCLTREEGGMLAVINPLETLESMLPEWEMLLQTHQLAVSDLELSFYIHKRSYRLRFHRGALDITEGVVGKNRIGLQNSDLVHLLTGYIHLDDILARQRRILSGDARTLLKVLFPKRTPFVWPLDCF